MAASWAEATIPTRSSPRARADRRRAGREVSVKLVDSGAGRLCVQGALRTKKQPRMSPGGGRPCIYMRWGHSIYYPSFIAAHGWPLDALLAHAAWLACTR
eukprot:8912229-Pyramimonas_sp.AAC.1